MPLAEGAALLECFLPAWLELVIQSDITGPSTYTPDGLFVLGAAGTILEAGRGGDGGAFTVRDRPA